MEDEVRWPGGGRGSEDGAVAGGEYVPEQLVAELTLDKTMLQDVLQKVKPSRRGPMVDRQMSSYGASERHACRVLCVTYGT
ncbi:MAG: hypothetical protein HIU93_12360 [Acidobacteria bacterium]|nr:hypothetical protein [Acidobacteriota bacterium]